MPGWSYELRSMAGLALVAKDQVRLISRNGNDLLPRFP
jgi:hypothetical protein